MRTLWRALALAVVLVGSGGSALALTLSPQAKLSLITEDPGREIYLAFGHTALRVSDPVLGLDLLFNWGTIDPRYLSDPRFVARFIAGDLRYSLGVSRFRDATAIDKEWEDRDWFEQDLALSPEQVAKVWAVLEWNAQEENRAYQYDFVADNCSTRIPALLAKALGPEAIVWGKRGTPTTVRDLVAETLAQRPWWRFWSLFPLGAVTTRVATDEQVWFLPGELMRSARDAVLRGAPDRPLVSAERRVLEGQPRGSYDEPNSDPAPWLWALVLVVAAASVAPWKPLQSRLAVRLARVGDATLFFLIALGGAILVFLTFFSVHSATHENWNLIWMNPLWLVAAVFSAFRARAWHAWVWGAFAVMVLLPLPLLAGPQPLVFDHVPVLALIVVRVAHRLLAAVSTGNSVKNPLH